MCVLAGVRSGAVPHGRFGDCAGRFHILGHDTSVKEPARGCEQKPRGDLETITIFGALADEYLELISAVGPVHESPTNDEEASRTRIALSLRLMLERKFVSPGDAGTYIPFVLDALCVELPDSSTNDTVNGFRQEYDEILSGESTAVSANFNNVELDFASIRKVFAYGGLMHSDRDKWISSTVLRENVMHLMVRQSVLLAAFIARVRLFINESVETGALPGECDSIHETWLQVHDDPEAFGLGERKSVEDIPALNDDGSEPLPGGQRRRAVSFVTPELGRTKEWQQQFGDTSPET